LIEEAATFTNTSLAVGVGVSRVTSCRFAIDGGVPMRQTRERSGERWRVPPLLFAPRALDIAAAAASDAVVMNRLRSTIV
jgi:hypothetical protein